MSQLEQEWQLKHFDEEMYSYLWNKRKGKLIKEPACLTFAKPTQYKQGGKHLSACLYSTGRARD